MNPQCPSTPELQWLIDRLEPEAEPSFLSQARFAAYIPRRMFQAIRATLVAAGYSKWQRAHFINVEGTHYQIILHMAEYRSSRDRVVLNRCAADPTKEA